MPRTNNRKSGQPAPKRGPRYPGIPSVKSGLAAALWVEANTAQAAAYAPDEACLPEAPAVRAALSRYPANLWTEEVALLEGPNAPAAAIGFALSGGRVFALAAGRQVSEWAAAMPEIAGRRLPIVIHAPARALDSQSRTYSTAHDSIVTWADAGWAVLFPRNPQEAADLSLIARRAAEAAETPFLCAQDASETSLTTSNLLLPEFDFMRFFVEAPTARIRNYFNPSAPMAGGVFQSDASYMKGRIAQRFFFDCVEPALRSSFEEFAELTGRRYDFLQPYRMEGARYAVIGLGSMMETVESVVDELRNDGIPAGAVSILSLRPFPADALKAILTPCQAVTVLERTDAALASRNPLAREVAPLLDSTTRFYSGVAGLGVRGVRSSDITAAFSNMRRPEGVHNFVLGVRHPDALAPEPSAPPPAQSLFFAAAGTTDPARLAQRLTSLASETLGLKSQAWSTPASGARYLPVPVTLRVSLATLRTHQEPEAYELFVATSPSDLRFSPAAKLLAPHSNVILAASPAAIHPEYRAYMAQQHAKLWHVPGDAHPLRLAGAAIRILATEYPPLSDPHASIRRAMAAEGVDESGIAHVIAGYDETTEVPYAQDPDPKPGADWRVTIRPASQPPETPGMLLPSGFCDRIVGSYQRGREAYLEADLFAARGLMPSGTAGLRSWRDRAESIPTFEPTRCDGCLACITSCPDTAIIGRIVEPEVLDHKLEAIEQPELRDELKARFLDLPQYPGGLFSIFIDPDKCKGCGDCVSACDHHAALAMSPRPETSLRPYDLAMDLYQHLPETPARFLTGSNPAEMMLTSYAQLYTGGAASCAGCGESIALRALLTVAAYQKGSNNIGIVAASGCHTRFGATFPYNPYQVPWTTTTAETAPSAAIAIDRRWRQQKLTGRQVWIVGDEAMAHRATGEVLALLDGDAPVKVLILDYGDARTSALREIAISRDRALVAQTTPAHLSHFAQAISAASSYDGPALVICYAACINDQHLSPDAAMDEARDAVSSGQFPLLITTPRQHCANPPTLGQ